MPTMQVNSGTRKQTTSRGLQLRKSLANDFNDLPFGWPDRDAGERGQGTMAPPIGAGGSRNGWWPCAVGTLLWSVPRRACRRWTGSRCFVCRSCRLGSVRIGLLVRWAIKSRFGPCNAHHTSMGEPSQKILDREVADIHHGEQHGDDSRSPKHGRAPAQRSSRRVLNTGWRTFPSADLARYWISASRDDPMPMPRCATLLL
jgi:hypothetical protein